MTNIEVETLLRQNKIPYTFMEDGYWQLKCEENLILMFHNEDSEFLRLVMPLVPVPSVGQTTLFRFLLELNCSGVFCGSFAIHPDSESIIYIDQIPTIDLDITELMASLNSFIYVLDNHLETIKQFLPDEEKPDTQ